MTKIETELGQVELISMNLELLCADGFIVPLDKKEEYIDKVPVPNKDIMETIIEEILEEKSSVEKKQIEFKIDCMERQDGQEIAASWEICFKVIEYYKPKLRNLSLIKVCYANSKKEIPFKIEGIDVSIKIGKKWAVVPIHNHSTIRSGKLSIVFPFFGCSLEAIYNK